MEATRQATASPAVTRSDPEEKESFLVRLGFPRPLLWGFLGLLLFMIGDGVETNILSPYLQDAHGFSVSLAGSLVTVYGAMVAVAAFGAAALSDLWGPRRVMMTGAGIWITMEVLFLSIALTHSSTWLIFLTYGLRGLGYPLFAYGFLVWITATARKDKLATSIGWFYVAFTLGLPALGAVVATFSLSVVQLTMYQTFWVSACLVVLGSLAALIGVKERTGRHPLVDNPDETVATLTFGFKLLATDRRVLFVALARMINSIPTYGMAVFFPVLFRDQLGLSVRHFLILTTVIYAVNIPFNPIFGAVGDKIGWVKTSFWFGAILCCVSMFGLYAIPAWGIGAGWNPTLAYGLTIVAGVFFGIGLAGFVPLSAIVVSCSPDHPGAAMSAYNLGMGSAVFMGPLLVALLYDHIGAMGLSFLFSALYLVAAAMITQMKGTQEAAIKEESLPINGDAVADAVDDAA